MSPVQEFSEFVRIVDRIDCIVEAVKTRIGHSKTMSIFGLPLFSQQFAHSVDAMRQSAGRTSRGYNRKSTHFDVIRSQSHTQHSLRQIAYIVAHEMRHH